jgi:hypothetical protein
MKLRVFDEYGALNSKPVFTAFKEGAIACNDVLVKDTTDADAVVIWSVLFHGKMKHNQRIWKQAQSANKPVIVLEVGTLHREQTWRIGINGINKSATWATVNQDRSRRFNITLNPWQDNNKKYITVATQHPASLQWQNMPAMETWIDQTVNNIRQYSSRPIIIRKHPRDRMTNWRAVQKKYPEIRIDTPIKTGNYDAVNFDSILSQTHVLVNHCTTPAVDAIISGVPVIVGDTSMCWDLRTELADIENPNKPDRTKWLRQLQMTEFYIDEIKQGWPWKSLRALI